MSFNLMYVIAAYFFVILVFSEPKYRVHSAIILFFTILNIYFELPVSTNKAEYISNRGINIAWDGIAGIIMIMCLPLDKLAGKQALILAFAITCHTMIIWYLITPSWFSLFFYSYYDELVILAGLLQMGVSYNGFVTSYNNALHRLQGIIFWSRLSVRYLRKSLFARKKREIKT